MDCVFADGLIDEERSGGWKSQWTAGPDISSFHGVRISIWLLYSGIIDLMMEAVCTSETSVNFYEATWRNIPKDSRL
jgi:hypothetical protein